MKEPRTSSRGEKTNQERKVARSLSDYTISKKGSPHFEKRNKP